MRNNLFIKIIASIPVILVTLYFIPFLGVCLMILRLFIYSNKKRIKFPIILTIAGVLILIPKLLSLIKVNIPYLSDIVTSDLYNVNFISYSKLLITVGIIFIILSVIAEIIFNKAVLGVRKYIENSERQSTEISKQNDLIMKEKREKAANTSVVYCPYCGADNILESSVGTCKFCRRQITSKK